MLEQLRKRFSISEDKWNSFTPCFKRIQVAARATLLKEGEISRQFFFIEKGCVRVCLNKDGKDLTFQFFFENESVSSTESFRNDTPSIVAIETVEPCTLYVIGKTDMRRLLAEGMNDPEIQARLIDVLYERNIYYMKHCLSFIKDTPEQRYLHLLKENPQVIRRVPQRYIASYLGVTSVHLSRIKSKLAKARSPRI